MDHQIAATSDGFASSNDFGPSNSQNVLGNANILENGTPNVKSTPNHHVHNNNHKHHESKERKFDLNSFSTVKTEAVNADEDDDDKPLAIRKQKPVEHGTAAPKDKNCLPNRTSLNADSDSRLHHINKQKNDDHHLNKPAKIEEKPRKSLENSNQSEPAVVIVKEKQYKQEKSEEKQQKQEKSEEKKPSTSKNGKVKREEPEERREKQPAKVESHHKMTEVKHKDKDYKAKLADKDDKAGRINKDEKAVKKRPKIEETEDEDELPLAERSKKSKQVKKEESSKKRHKYVDEEDSADEKPSKKTKIIQAPSPSKPGGRKKKEEEQHEVWKWWEEEGKQDGVKWKYLEHKGPMFAPPYVPLPSEVEFYYDGKPMKLSKLAEEVATFYSKMIEHDYVTQDAFNKNFFKDWRKVMTGKEKETITELSKCGFKVMHAYFTLLSEERKGRSKEEKQKEKEKAEQIQKEYGIAVIDGHKEKIGNFRIEPPGLFRGRGTHPKMGMLKKRIQPEDVIINCSKDSKIPEPPAGHKWKEIRHDNTVTWLASWSENIMGGTKYVMLNPSSKIKGEKDWQKYEIARHLKSKAHRIRETYKEDWKSKEMKTRQRAVALYFIDKLALRAGNEKEEGETADTVGCCSLRCEHIKLHEQMDGKEWVVEFDFLGKDSIRYYNRTPVEKRVFKNLKLFMENKSPGDDLFDRLNTAILNKHLTTLMDGLTAKVFRTYNASFTLQQQLDLLTKEELSPVEKLLSYNRANRQVAVLCNHQRAVPKAHGKQMELLQEKIDEKVKAVKSAKGELKDAKKACKESRNEKNKKLLEQKEKKYERMQDELQKLEVKATDKEENKEISLGTSKLNYLDPRISVAWCKKWSVPIEKVYNKTQREKFRWAIDMAGADFKW